MKEYQLKPAERITRTETYGGVEFETIYRKALKPVTPEYLSSLPLEERGGLGAAPEFNPRTYYPRPTIMCPQDVGIQMRDGTIIYVDLYRPVTDEKIPAILS